jgi:hypothetical protein
MFAIVFTLTEACPYVGYFLAAQIFLVDIFWIAFKCLIERSDEVLYSA